MTSFISLLTKKKNNHNVIDNPIVFHFEALSKQENNFLLKEAKKKLNKPRQSEHHVCRRCRRSGKVF